MPCKAFSGGRDHELTGNITAITGLDRGLKPDYK
jgi:hypothetical protein